MLYVKGEFYAIQIESENLEIAIVKFLLFQCQRRGLMKVSAVRPRMCAGFDAQ